MLQYSADKMISHRPTPIRSLSGPVHTRESRRVISARLDAPDVLHHIIIRGIERCNIFRDNSESAGKNKEVLNIK